MHVCDEAFIGVPVNNADSSCSCSNGAEGFVAAVAGRVPVHSVTGIIVDLENELKFIS